MLTKILAHLNQSFARTIKPKPPLPHPSSPTPNPSPQTFNKKMKQMDEKLQQKVKALMNQNLKEEHILDKFILQDKIKSQQDIYSQYQVDVVRQQMMLNQISKKFEKSKKELAIGGRFEKGVIDQEEKDHKQRYILEKLRKQNPQAKQLTFQEQLKHKYPEQLIKLAQQKINNSKLSQFKQQMSDKYLKQEHENPQRINMMQRRLSKNETYKQRLQKDKQERQEKKQLKLLKNQQRKNIQEKKKIEKELNRVVSQEIVQYEDQQYYKDKGMRQFQAREVRKDVDQGFLDAGEKDMKESSEKYNIFLDQYEEIKEDNSYKKQLYDESSFGKMDRKMKDLENRLKSHGINVDIQQLKGMKKDLLFQQKREREQQLQFKKNLMKKQKKKQMKLYYKKIHEQKLREDLDYDKDFQNRFKQFEYDPLDVEANIQKMKEINLQRKALFVNKDIKIQNHFKKTQKNIGNFILSCFYQNLLNANESLYEQIQIRSLHFNEKKTVVNIFWAFLHQNLSKDQIQKGKMQKKLKKSANFISGKMTQYLGLRYGPDIRFYYDTILKQTQQIKQGLLKEKDHVIQFELNHLLKKGHIANQQELASTKQKLSTIAQENIRNYHNRGKLLSKKYQKMERKSKKTPNQKKKSADERLWDHLDTL